MTPAATARRPTRRTFLGMRRSTWVSVIQFLVLVGILTWFLVRGSQRMGYNWQWYRIPQYLFTFEDGHFQMGRLLQGLMVTFEITAWSLVLCFAFGLVTALLRLSHSTMGRVLARGYLETIRNTPLLVQIFLMYFVVGPVLGIGRFASAVLALSLFEGAYASEIFRAGIVSIHKGQWEAAYSLGLSKFHTYTHIILPQAVRRILPPLTSQAVSLIKDSALVSTIAIYELAMAAQSIVAETFLTFELWFTVAGIYLVVTVTLSSIVNAMERRFNVPH